ncbi:hypothetical protein CEY12_21100 [Chryseobacterium sp. T16E-39]|uniref:hypothetical protein n=1 Tax=Chryseobacterium sp. T16E-39 TaxID=2015076 RepID=UPI000B5B4395|nr:hypothetical protein [Chryseobacterium sp. T16E-39]ASK32427.1 hypothetical protein CEY12_21100 [Chryseobacterium sp. T16E-39]
MKRIYYVPGLISAVLIPFLFWYYAGQRAHLPYTFLEFGLPSKHRYNDSIDNTFESFRTWKFKKIIVQPNTAVQNQQYYISELKKLQKRNERETGIEFIIGDKNTLQDFTTLIDAMSLAKQEAYGLDVGNTDHFFAIHFYKDPNERIHPICGGTVGDVNHNYKAENYYTGYQKFEYELKQVPQQAYYVIFGFLLFLNISMLSINENFQINKNPFKYIH